MAGKLDRIDLKILRLLQNSGRLTNTELAETAGVSAATCHRRTKRLFDEGYRTAGRPPDPDLLRHEGGRRSCALDF